MWIRIQRLKLMWVHADPDPKPCTAGQKPTSVLHLLWNLVRVEHAGNGDVHLPLLVLSGAQCRVSFLQVQVTVVFA